MDERVQEKKSTIAHSLAKEVDCQDKNMEKKLSKKRKKSASEDNTNGGDHSILTEEEQNKKTKTEKMLSKENKRSEDREYEPIKELAKHNEREGDDGGKKKKTKKKHKEYNDSKSNERKKSASDDHTNGGDHSILTEEEQSKKKKKTEKMLSKKNKRSEDGEYETIEELAKHNESGDDEGDKKKKKKKKKKHKEYNDSKNNESRDDDGGKKKKKKKKHKEYNDSKSNECEDDGQVKKMEKKQLTEQSKLQEYDDTVEKTKTEKNLSKKNKQSGDEEHETNGGNPYLVKNNEREDDDQGKKLKKKKLSDESKHKEDNKFRNNVGEDADQGKKMKKKMKKKLSDESKHKEDNDFRNNVDEDGDIGKKKKKKKQSHKSKKNENCVLNSNEGEDGDQGNGGDQGENMKKRKKAEAVVGDSSNPADERASKRKRVTFSDQVEVCCDGLVRGKRFTPEEDEKIKASVYDYIESKGLGDEGLDMVLNSRKHREVRGCWKEIAEVIPYRPWYSVYHRAHVLFETVDSKWTPDELEFIRKSQGLLGSDWKSIAEGLGRGRHQVKDAWRNVKFTNAKRGNWSQEEYQNLFNLVNLDLRARALEDFRKVQHGMFRDNVSWESVGTKLSTRSSAMCCMKWYNKLTSPMVASGEWCDTDDFRMINALYTLDACCMEEVDWDYLLEHRSGDVCRKRWGQMVQHIGEHAGKSFAEQVEILAKRFCPELLEAREAFDNKPVVC